MPVKDHAHFKYILFNLTNKHSYIFLVFSYVFYYFVPMNAKRHASHP